MARVTRSVAVCAAFCCGVGACVAPADNGPKLDQAGQLLEAENGLTTNGLTTNGMTTNGMTTNGMTTNGLTANGLTTNGLTVDGLAAEGFGSWFAATPATYADMVMRYLVRCAVPAGQTRTYTGASGATFVWEGLLGLAPAWASGQGFPAVEQQLVSACMAAHANKFGVNVPISVRGFLPDGTTQIPVDPSETTAYTVKEGCFFGNLFDGTGVFSAWDDGLWKTGKTSPRACAAYDGKPGSCAPMASALKGCSGICHQLSGAVNNGIWQTCSLDGVAYRAITVRIRPADVYLAGDKVCQFTESCRNEAGRTGTTDCGLCQ